MPVPPTYVQGLVTYAEARGDLGKQKLLDLHERLFERIEKNEGKELVNSSINGKSFGFQVNMTVEEQFAAVGEAVRELTGDDKVTQTYADFTGLQR